MDKTWTASDLNMGVLRLNRQDDISTLSVIQGYEFSDADGDAIDDLPKKTISFNILYSELPTDIQTCLLQMFDFIYEKALTKEGMDDAV